MMDCGGWVNNIGWNWPKAIFIRNIFSFSWLNSGRIIDGYGVQFHRPIHFQCFNVIIGRTVGKSGKFFAIQNDQKIVRFIDDGQIKTAK